MRHNHYDTAFLGLCRLNHMADKDVISLGLGRNASTEAVIRVVLNIVAGPFLKGERGIGDNKIELHQGIAFFEQRVIKRIAPFQTG